MDKSNYNDVYIPRDGVGAGNLAIAGENTLLKLLNASPPASSNKEFRDLHGTLNDGSKASLLQCIPMGSMKYGLGKTAQHETSFFPHYVLIGNYFISSDEAKIQAINYHFENVGCLVNTLRTFGTIYPGSEEFRRVIEADHQRSVKIAEEQGWDRPKLKPGIGDDPVLQYYSGCREIMQCRAQVGTIEMNNHVSHGMGGASGVSIDNEIVVSLKFADPVAVSDAFMSLNNLHSFFELCLGRRQRYLRIEAQLVKEEEESDDPFAGRLQAYWSYCNERISGKTSPTHYLDVLLDAGAQQAEFGIVLSNWLDSETSVGEARSRFANGFHSGSYSIDRIVGSANMFDLLPSTHVPSNVKLDKPTSDAIEKSREYFKALPENTVRQSTLSALGRIGKASLRDKIFHRANILIETDPNKFADLRIPCHQAVLCRNHFVHGSEGTFDYRKEINAFIFLIETLEFVFAASDLIELGWNYSVWRSKGSTLRHKFGSYAYNYESNLEMLKQLINA